MDGGAPSRLHHFKHIWRITRRAPVESLFSDADEVDSELYACLSTANLEKLSLLLSNARLIEDRGWLDDWVTFGPAVFAQEGKITIWID